MKTNYTIEKSRETYRVLKHGKIEAQGFGDVESALHAVWVLEGKKMSEFYTEVDGDVHLIIDMES